MITFNHIPEKKRATIISLVTALTEVSGIEAIALGGSYATGRAHTESDIDLGIYYRESSPFSVSEIQKIVHMFDASAVVTQLYEWGPWVNGGVWLNTDAGKVDLIFRNIDQINRIVTDSFQGKWYWDFAQQPAFGFYSVMYLGEIRINVALYDPTHVFELLKKEIEHYPEALRKVLIQDNMWGAEFTLMQAEKFAKRADAYATAGCITRICAYLTQVLFALNSEYFLTDKGALEIIENFKIKPNQYKQLVIHCVGNIGTTHKELEQTIARVGRIVHDVKELASEFYNKKY